MDVRIVPRRRGGRRHGLVTESHLLLLLRINRVRVVDFFFRLPLRMGICLGVDVYLRPSLRMAFKWYNISMVIGMVSSATCPKVTVGWARMAVE